PRYLIPLVPVIVFGMAESAPRLWRQWLERADAKSRAPRRAAGSAFARGWIAGVLLARFALHPAVATRSSQQGEIRDAIAEAIDPDQVILTNFMATRKFLPELDMKYIAVDRARIDAETANSLVERYGEAYIVFLDRGDSAFWVGDARVNADFLRDI